MDIWRSVRTTLQQLSKYNERESKVSDGTDGSTHTEGSISYPKHEVKGANNLLSYII